MMDSLEQGQQAVKGIANGEKGRLMLGSTNSFTAQLLWNLLEGFLLAYPDIDLQVRSFSTKEVFQHVKRGKFNIGFTRYSIDDNGLTYRMIHNEDIFLILSSKHSWASKKSVRLEEIVEQPVILYPKGTQYRETIDFSFKRLNIPLNVKYELTNLDLIKQSIEHNIGVTLFPKSYMSKELAYGKFVKIPS